jgi:hypothetical protein
MRMPMILIPEVVSQEVRVLSVSVIEALEGH